jgi:magnesium-transporting ATPase (P-type)
MSQPDAEPRVKVTPPDDPKRPRRLAARYLSWMFYAATALSLVAFLTMYVFLVFEANATVLQAFFWGVILAIIALFVSGFLAIVARLLGQIASG